MRLTEPLVGRRFLDELIEQLREAVRQAAELMEKSCDENWAAALGGLKRTASARLELSELMGTRAGAQESGPAGSRG